MRADDIQTTHYIVDFHPGRCKLNIFLMNSAVVLTADVAVFLVTVMYETRHDIFPWTVQPQTGNVLCGFEFNEMKFLEEMQRRLDVAGMTYQEYCEANDLKLDCHYNWMQYEDDVDSAKRFRELMCRPKDPRDLSRLFDWFKKQLPSL